MEGKWRIVLGAVLSPPRLAIIESQPRDRRKYQVKQWNLTPPSTEESRLGKPAHNPLS